MWSPNQQVFERIQHTAGTKIDEGGVKELLLNDLSKPFEFILLDPFNKKLHAYSLNSDIQRIGNAYLGRIKPFLQPIKYL